MNLTVLAIGLAVFVSSATGAYFYGHNEGFLAGAHDKQVEWDRIEFQRQEQDKKLRDDDRDEGFALAAEYEQHNHELEQSYERTQKQLAAALQTQVVCPKSGKVGDIVLPAGVVRGMFGHDGAASAVPPRPAPAKPASSVR